MLPLNYNRKKAKQIMTGHIVRTDLEKKAEIVLQKGHKNDLFLSPELGSDVA